MADTKTVHSPLVTYASVLSLLTLCPPFVTLLWYTMAHVDGSVRQTWDFLKQHGLQGFINIWPRPTAALQLLLPGKRVEGPISPRGNRPVYKANGMAAYTVTLVTYLSLWCCFCQFIISMALGYHHKNAFLPCYSLTSFLVNSFSSLKYEQSGKVADSMLVNTILMLVYVTKFFWWEAGYWNTMDIAHDRAGFYICWGCLVVWVPSVYTSPGMYLVNHPVNLGLQAKAGISQNKWQMFGLGKGSIKDCGLIHYSIWGIKDEPPFDFRVASVVGHICCQDYLKPSIRSVLLYPQSDMIMVMSSAEILYPGFCRWGLSRHFYYVPEILAALFWTVPALFNHFLCDISNHPSV
ncbi:7-dehydrocholesterol reductase [Salix suchowensis]|nr:7-dehydrocholesterol reductase [Salix suchowensis]